MTNLENRSVLLCVTGSIAAYKAADLARLLVKAGCDVNVAMTEAATELIGPMTFEALTGNHVFLDVFESAEGPVDRYGPASGGARGGGNGPASNIKHIEVSKRPDLILIAPATADVIGRIANGLADDVVTTSVLAAKAPVVLAPAMNQRMWANPIVRSNVKKLEEAGYAFIGPAAGDLACGETGMGRMVEPAEILRALPRVLGGGGTGPRIDLRKKKILVALGRTEEPVDPVRSISNRSTGRMGVAIAEAARDAGAEVTVVAGPTSVPLPEGVDVVHVTRTEEMKNEVHDRFGSCDALIMVAAVSDYQAATEKLHKMESGQKHVSIDLVPTEDILLSLKPKRKKQLMVGFALETQAEEQRGRKKLQEKGLDLVVVNNPLKPGAALGGETNLVTFLHKSGATYPLPVLPKDRVAVELLRQVEYLLKNPSGTKPPRPDASEGEAQRAVESRSTGMHRDGGDSRGSSSGRPRSRGGRRRSPKKRPSVKSGSSAS